MPLIRVSSFDDDETKPFQTFKNYVGGLALIVRETYGDPPFRSLRDATSVRIRKGGLNPLPKEDREERARGISHDFRNAWATELAMSIPGHVAKNDLLDLMLAANHWTPTQAHYAVYRALRGTLRALKLDPRETHEDVLEMTWNQLVQRHLLPIPWACQCSEGSPPGIKPAHDYRWIEFPEDVEVPSNLTQPRSETMWGLTKLALKKTRDHSRRYESRCRQRQNEIRRDRKLASKGNAGKSGRINLKTSERVEFFKDVPPTTLFDFLYWMRRRLNYIDDDSFLAEGISPFSAASFNRDLVLIARATLHSLECIVDAAVGEDHLKGLRDKFSAQVPESLQGDSVGSRYA